MKKKILAIVATLVMSFCVCMCYGTIVFACTDSGSCGDSLTWAYNTSSGVLTIKGDGAMKNYPWDGYKSHITQVEFTGNVTAICNYAFSDCNNLESITIPSSVQTIGYSAFKNCGNLENVKFDSDSNLISLGSSDYNRGVFQDCKNLESITLPNKLTAINHDTFNGCSNLESIVIGSNVKLIGWRAFQDCICLEAIEVPNSVATIDGYAFNNCKNLSNVKLSNDLKTIGEHAFVGCTDLSNIIIPSSVTSIGESAFKDLSNLKSITFADDSNLTKLGTDAYNRGVFQNCTGLTTIVLPNKLTAINHDTFNGCSNLGSVTIGNSVESIGWRAFESCVKLKSIIVPDSVKKIDGYAFDNCTSLSKIALGNSLETIGNNAFTGCTSLSSIDIPASVISIGESVFKNLSNLKSVVFESNSNLTELGSKSFYNCGVFQGCTGLTSVILPDKLTAISYDTFYGCNNLKSIKIGKHVTNVYGRAFGDCISLEKIIIPKSVTSIGLNAFSNCLKLNRVYYTGSESNWNNLKSSISDGNDALINSQSIQYNSSINAFDLSSISVKSKPTKIFYYVGDTFDITGLVLLAKFNDSSTEEITDRFTYSPVDLNTVGVQTVTVMYEGKNTSFDVTVNVAKNLCIISQPEDTIAKEGDKLTFTIVAEGDDITYKWQFSDDNCKSWRTTANVTGDTLETTLTEQNNHRCFQCILKDIHGNKVVSKTFSMEYLTIGIISQPSSVNAKAGNLVSFKITAAGDGLTYQWQLSDDQGTTWRNSSVKNASYTTTLSTNNNGRYVRCIVTDKYCHSVKSNAAYMKITSLKITTQPASATVKNGAMASFKVVATGPSITYQWQLSDDQGKTWRDSSNKTATYSTTLSDKNNGRYVRCVVTDKYGNSLKSNAAYMKITSLKITTQPASATVKNGATASFKVVATGPSITYQWQLSDDQGKTWRNSKATTANYSATVTDSNNGRYVRCIVTDKYGNSVKSNATYMKITSLKITSQPVNAKAAKGGTVTFKVVATGPSITYQWQLSDDQGKTWRDSSNKTATYSTTLSDKNNGRYVRCVVTDKYGNSVKSNAAIMKVK